MGRLSAPLHHRESGRESAPVILFMHGFLGHCDDLAPLAHSLEANYRCLLVDLPGHGGSTGRADGEYSLAGAADAVVRVLDDARADRAILFGYSMGGRVAMHVADRHPSRVRALVLESAHPGLGDPDARSARRALDEARAASLQREPRAFLEAWYRQPMFAGAASKPRLRDRLVEDRLTGDVDDMARALMALSTGKQQPLGERVRNLGVPTMLVAGALDSRYVEAMSALARGADSVALRIVQDAGHAVHLDQPELFSQLVRDFAESLIEHHPSCP